MIAALPPKLLKNIAFEPNTGCWLWSGYLASNGYGRFHRRAAHRLVYEAVSGPIPAGLDLDHLCRVRQCVNPEHLEPVTRSENLRRGSGAKMLGRMHRSKTHCPSGHEYNDDNTYVGKRGSRSCRECARLRRSPVARWRHKPLRPVCSLGSR